MTNLEKKYDENPYKFLEDNLIGINSENFKCELLKLSDTDLKILKHFHENNLSLTKKSRQMHLTTLAAGYCAWMMLFKNNIKIAIVAPRKGSSNRFIEILRIILQNYSNDYFYWEDDFVTDKKGEIRLSNGSFIKSFAANKTSMRGYSYDVLIIDESAFIKPDVIDAFIMNTDMNTHGKLITYSTPNGYNHFYKLWNESIKGNKNFDCLSVNWIDNPIYTKGLKEVDGVKWSPWFEERCKMLNYDEYAIKSELYGEFVKKKNKSSHRINFRIDHDLYSKLNDKISNKNISISEYVRKLIEEDLK